MPTDLASNLTLQLRQVNESSVETDADGNKYTQELPGFLELGVVVDGAWWTVARRKAPGFLADIERAKAAAAADANTTGDGTTQSA